MIFSQPSSYGPWFTASYDSDCSECGCLVSEDDQIRSDGDGGWLCEDCGDNTPGFAELLARFEAIQARDSLPDPDTPQPVCVIARTRKGHGVAFMEQAPQAWHLGLMPAQVQADAIAEISGRMT